MKEWETFYVITGAAGSTLIGIEFIVITLVATIRTRETSSESLGAFATPTVVHFAAALVVSAIMAAPWPSRTGLAILLALFAAGGFLYAVTIMHRTRRQTTYAPTREDWLWYVFLPCAAYALLIVAGVLLPSMKTPASFVAAAATLMLLLIGIHNAWDTVTFLVVGD